MSFRGVFKRCLSEVSLNKDFFLGGGKDSLACLVGLRICLCMHVLDPRGAQDAPRAHQAEAKASVF